MNLSSIIEDRTSLDFEEYSSSEADEKSLLRGAGRHRIAPAARKALWTIVGVLIVFAFLGWIATSLSNRDPVLLRAYESGFKTDLEAVTSQVELVETVFTGGIELDRNGTFYRSEDRTQVQYVGAPSPAIDKAWTNLLTGLNIDLSITEIPHTTERTYQWKDDHYFFSGLDVFHSLHCLNRIRQALHPKYYTHVFEDHDDPVHDLHIDHCIDHLRQALQCHSDLTPMTWEKRENKLLLKNGAKHTCRNFDKIHEWASPKQIDYQKKPELARGELHLVD